MKKSLFPFVLSVLLLAVSFQSCQKDEIVETEDITLKSTAPVINLIYPETDVTAGENFDITYSSTCGKIMLERAYVLEFDAVSGTYNQVFVGLTCENENLQWESVGEDVFITCAGETITQNIEATGTYVYRAKLNMKAIKNSGCPDCGDFEGNQYECFMITVVAGNQNEGTFTDPRDNHEYKTIKIGNQVWMAENLAYYTETGCYFYGENTPEIIEYPEYEALVLSIFGRLYTWDAAFAACPPGWHLPTDAEWTELANFLINNGYGYGGSGDDIAKALADTEYWSEITSGFEDAPGSNAITNNSSGFSGRPGGYRYQPPAPAEFEFLSISEIANWWSATGIDETANAWILYYASGKFQNLNGFSKNTVALSVRCIRD